MPGEGPRQRPQTARELAEEFRRAAGLGDAPPRRTVAGPPRTRRTAALVGAAVVLVACVGLGTMMIPGAPSGRAGAGAERGRERLGARGTPPPPPPVGPVLWEPKGYAAVDSSDIVPEHPGFPVRLKRKDDDAQFVFFGEASTSPTATIPAPTTTWGSGWPSVIVRKSDKVRFIRIPGTSTARRPESRRSPSPTPRTSR